MSEPSKTKDGVEQLHSAATALLAVLQQFIAVLSTQDPVPANNTLANPPEPLDVLHTSATLVKAQSTKLSLLIINKPFTPTAIRTVIVDISGTCVPAMMSAVEICRPSSYSRTMHEEVKARTRRIFRELEAMMKEILTHVTPGEPSEDTKVATRDSLASTGVVWEACDSLMELKSLGLSGLLVKKAKEYRDLLVDAIEELKEWAEDAEDEGFDEEEDGLSDGEDSVTKMLTAANKLPKDREDIKKLLDASLQRLRLISSLYQALVAKRLKTIPSTTATNLTQADSMMKFLRQIPMQTDHLAEAFYDLDIDTARKVLGEIVVNAKDAVKLGRKNWNANNDEFTEWCDKWGRILEKT